MTAAGRLRFIPLEDLIANHLGDLFPGMEILEHHEFRVTRNEDVEIEEDEIREPHPGAREGAAAPPVRAADPPRDHRRHGRRRRSTCSCSELGHHARRRSTGCPAPLDLGGLFEICQDSTARR